MMQKLPGILAVATLLLAGQAFAEAQSAKTRPASNRYTGIGVTVAMLDGLPTVVSVIPDSPASRDGRLAAGDRLIAVSSPGDITRLKDRSIRDVSRDLRGPVDSEVTLVIEKSRPVAGQHFIAITRGSFLFPPNIDEPKFELLSIARFGERACAQIRTTESPNPRQQKKQVIYIGDEIANTDYKLSEIKKDSVVLSRADDRITIRLNRHDEGSRIRRQIAIEQLEQADRIDELLRDGRILLANDQFAAAYQKFSAVLQLNPAHREARQTVAEIDELFDVAAEGRTTVLEKLKQITIPRFACEDTPISTAARELETRIRELDPARIGVPIEVDHAVSRVKRQPESVSPDEPISNGEIAVAEAPGIAEPLFDQLPSTRSHIEIEKTKTIVRKHLSIVKSVRTTVDVEPIEPVSEDERRVKLNLVNVTALEAIHHLTRGPGLDYRIAGDRVLIIDPQIAALPDQLQRPDVDPPPPQNNRPVRTVVTERKPAANDMETWTYKTNGSFVGGAVDKNEPTAMGFAILEFLKDNGIDFPSGAHMNFRAKASALHITNSIDNLQRIQRIITEAVKDAAQPAAVWGVPM